MAAYTSGACRDFTDSQLMNVQLMPLYEVTLTFNMRKWLYVVADVHTNCFALLSLSLPLLRLLPLIY